MNLKHLCAILNALPSEHDNCSIVVEQFDHNFSIPSISLVPYKLAITKDGDMYDCLENEDRFCNYDDEFKNVILLRID